MRVAIVVASGFQDEEFVYPYYRFQEVATEVLVASTSGKDEFGKFGVPARVSLTTSDLLRSALPDCLYIPGGFESPDRLRLDSSVIELVRRMDQENKLIAAICHGPWVLISAGIVQNRTVTGYDSIQIDLKNAGAIVPPEKVFVDGNIVSAVHYRNNAEFMKAVVASLASSL